MKVKRRLGLHAAHLAPGTWFSVINIRHIAAGVRLRSFCMPSVRDGRKFSANHEIDFETYIYNSIEYNSKLARTTQIPCDRFDSLFPIRFFAVARIRRTHMVCHLIALERWKCNFTRSKAKYFPLNETNEKPSAKMPISHTYFTEMNMPALLLWCSLLARAAIERHRNDIWLYRRWLFVDIVFLSFADYGWTFRIRILVFDQNTHPLCYWMRMIANKKRQKYFLSGRMFNNMYFCARQRRNVSE